MGCLQGLWGGSATESGNWVGRDFKQHPVLILCHGQGQLPLEQGAPSPIHTCLHPSREKSSLWFELSLKLLLCSPRLFWAGLGASCTGLCPRLGLAPSLKRSQGVCAIPPRSLQAGLGLGLEGWEGNLWSGSLELEWILCAPAQVSCRKLCVSPGPCSQPVQGHGHSSALGRNSEHKAGSETPRVLQLCFQRVLSLFLQNSPV